jgi:hypothetical protein
MVWYGIQRVLDTLRAMLKDRKMGFSESMHMF